MWDIWLKILAEVTGFLSVVVFPVSLATYKLFEWYRNYTEQKITETENIAPKVPPINEAPPWFKALTPNNPNNPNSKPLIREIESTEEETEEDWITETPKRKRQRMPSLEKIIQQLQSNQRLRIVLKLPKKGKIKLYGKDWEIEEGLLEIDTNPQAQQTPQKEEEKEELELEDVLGEVTEEETWKLIEEEEEKEEEEETG